MKNIGLISLLCLITHQCMAQKNDNFQLYIGTELIEPIATRFNSFGLNLGFRKSNYEIGIAYNHLNLPEKHLSAKSVKSVDGNQVEGKLRMSWLYLNYHPLKATQNSFLNSLYVSSNIGYLELEYKHIETGERYGTKSFATGLGIGTRLNDLFKIEGLFLDFTIPILYLTKGLKATYLEQTRINKQQFAYQGFLFVGYEF